MSQNAKELAEKLAAQFPDQFAPAVEFRGEITLTLKDPERIVATATIPAGPWSMNWRA
jgi:hypothetical protein